MTSPGPWSRGPVSRGVSLCSFVCRFGISLLNFLDSSVKVYRAPSCCIGWVLSGQGVSLSQINTIFAVERGVFDVSLSRGLRAGSELSGISLSSFVCRFGIPFLYLLDSSVQESRGIRAMDGRFVSKCIEQWGIASGVDGALDAKERVARGVI